MNMRLLQQPNQIYIGKINTSEKEIRDLIKAWVAISLAFAIVLRNAIGLSFYQVFIVSAIAVGAGFLLHELGHIEAYISENSELYYSSQVRF